MSSSLRIDEAGNRYGRLVVFRSTEPRKSRNQKWLCRCDCGVEKSVEIAPLRDGRVKSCGCWGREARIAAITTHGLSASPEYAIWKAMRRRCNNPKDPMYEHYGARGIKVSARWNKFANFIADVGRRPTDKHTIERVNNDGNYCPDNCIWIHRSQQSRNRRVTLYANVGKERPVLTEFYRAQEKPSVSYQTFARRYSMYGWSLSRALSEPSHRPWAVGR